MPCLPGAGTEPKTEVWNECGSPVTFVISHNLYRRHLTASQRAAVAVRADVMEEAERRARVRQQHSFTKTPAATRCHDFRRDLPS